MPRRMLPKIAKLLTSRSLQSRLKKLRKLRQRPPLRLPRTLLRLQRKPKRTRLLRRK